MFCPTCGSNIPDSAVRCKHCGADTAAYSAAGEPAKMVYCRNCGSQIAEEAESCVHCGTATTVAGKTLTEQLNPADGRRSWLTTILLCCAFFITGIGGIHRFYTGHIGIGIIQLLTGGGCMIWTIIDLVLILDGSYEDADGNALVK